ncbi:Clp protease N-terminal domain-containing protein [Actinoplanes couchii]|uniref:Clp domain protein n=1 Tax=Actinoplanes couchii TaxID=403638 RepID=A0ABQ3XKB8_9ACTN|nr:Clp protease N-terminal domain-containing protein [Actinoplanes couchii]MDR6320545.1 hypothetical protein [Actinoplanes couchii]GID58949.1 hypothetical protein Aco03nite_073530 [Actinoplanes couchii]
MADDQIRRSAATLADENDETRGRVGSDHLLTALLLHDDGVRERLNRFDVTPNVVGHVLRAETDRRSGPDVHGESLTLGDLLADDRSHAALMLAECGVDPAAVRDGRVPERPDPVKPELRECRDRLLGRVAFKGLKFRAFGIVPITFIYAPAPLMWARWEAEVIARRQSRRVRTDDVLVAMLGTLEVAEAYPHLMGAPEIYAGTRELLARGLDHERAAAVSASVDLGRDRVRPKRLLANPGRERRDTTHLLRMLLQHEDNRSVRLLRHLGLCIPHGFGGAESTSGR